MNPAAPVGDPGLDLGGVGDHGFWTELRSESQEERLLFVQTKAILLWITGKVVITRKCG
jgi:hypothetical protein